MGKTTAKEDLNTNLNRGRSHRIMCELLFGDHESIIRTAVGGYLLLDTFKFAKRQGIPAAKLKRHLSWCEQMGMIEELAVMQGKMWIVLDIPKGFSRIIPVSG